MTTPTDKTLPMPDPSERQVIQSYGEGGFRISGTRHEGAILVTAMRTSPWEAAAVATLDPALVPADIDVLVIGCGARAAFVPPAMREAFKRRGVALEVADTSAACRTYNILLSEGRRVAAALLPVP
ncbi:MAG: Mth938-like domain-containing protein [Reyranellaceae bacterium]